MSPIRQQHNPLILKLLREHDSLNPDQLQERQALQRRILFLMTTIKLNELEEERSRQQPKRHVCGFIKPSNELMRFGLSASALR